MLCFCFQTADEESESDIEAKKPRLSPKNELEVTVNMFHVLLFLRDVIYN